MDEHQLGSESIVIVDVRVLYYHVPEYYFDILPVGVFPVLLLVLELEFFGQVGSNILPRVSSERRRLGWAAILS
jgi:hypothetical protein